MTAKTKAAAKDMLKAVRSADAHALAQALAAGADVSAKDKNGWTAAMWATRLRHEPCLRMLIQAGVDLDAKDKNGWTAAMQAAYGGVEPTLRMLAEAGTDLSAKNNDGRTAATLAAFNGHLRLSTLIEAWELARAEAAAIGAASHASDAPTSRPGPRI